MINIVDFLFMFLKYFAAIAATITFSSIGFAQQWAATGDNDLRRDVELLKTYDIINGPINTWPISWHQITESINISAESSYPSHVKRAIDRIRRKIPNKGLRASASIRLTNESDLVRGFGTSARSDADLNLSIGYTDEKIDANISTNYRNDVTNNNVNLDGSYIATNIGNWSLYAGAIDRWWGPGQDNTLLLGTNARPMISAGLRRISPKAFKSKWLSWIGPWNWDMFIANMGKDRHVPDALMAGMRLGFEPINNLEIGFSRTIQICGQGRPCSFETWTRALISVGNLDNAAGQEEPGNQLASIDISYSMNLGDKSLRLYAEGTAEDQNVIMPFRYARLAGAKLTSPIGNKGDMLIFNTEWSDSGSVLAWFFGKRDPGTIYNHFIYRTGHRFDGRTLGHSLDNDSKLFSLSATYTRAEGESYNISLRTATLNWDNTTRNIVSAKRQKYKSLNVAATKQFVFGYLEAKMNIQSKAITLTQGILPRFTASIAWRIDI